MQSLPPSYANPDPRAMAIVGMSINAPGGESHGLDLEDFYVFLKNRGSGIVLVPSDRWNAEAFHGQGPGKICTKRGGFIPDFSSGDLQEFGITPTEGAQVMVSQIALLHQAFNALRRSGVDYRGSNTGVYVGCASGSYPIDIVQAGPYYMTGTSLSICANRINYVFDLLGPSMPVDTACSSSLTAMHLAIQAIRSGECDQAVVAGVNFVPGPLETAAFSQLGVLSPDGVSKAFDQGADGYARSDIGMFSSDSIKVIQFSPNKLLASAVVIKRHDLAVLDRDRIHATITGTALTSCGSIMGSLTTPSAEAQIQAIRAAYKDAKLEPHQADFVELHGTGTVVGDSIEANAAGSIFSEGRNGRNVIIGSVKSNIGHGEIGAYMSSLVKVVMMLERKEILPNGFFKQPSSKIDFKQYNLRVPITAEPFVAGDSQLGLIASISSFGFGGSCGHTVLRGHEPRPSDETPAFGCGPFLFAIGGLSPRACGALVEAYKEQHRETPPLTLSEHLGNQARHMPWRTYAVADSLDSAAFPDPVLVPKRPNPLAFCFSGQGPQHWQQGRQLFATFKVFRDKILECDDVYTQYTGNSFLVETGLFVTDHHETHLASSTVWKSSVTCISINFFQIALFDLLISIGIQPSAVIGHSVGEASVFYASGAMPLDMTIKISIARGRALDKTSGAGGSMVAVSGCNETDLRYYIQAVFSMLGDTPDPQDFLELATYNSSSDFAVSGSEKLVDMLIDFLRRWVPSAVARKLRVGTAPHSSMIDRCEVTFRAEVQAIFDAYSGRAPFIPKIPTISTVSAQFLDEGYSVEYIWKNLRQPVYFSQAIPNLVGRFGEATTFLEISPHPVLSQYLKNMGVHDSLPSSRRPTRSGALVEISTLYTSLGQLLTYGVNSLNFSILTGCPTLAAKEVDYPFQRKVYPIGRKEPSYLVNLLPKEPPLNSLRLRVSPELPEPWMADHVIDHSNLIPAAAYIEMALEFPGVTHVWDCLFQVAYILDEKAPPATLEVSTAGSDWWVKSSSSHQSSGIDSESTRVGPKFDIVHACGKLGYTPPTLDDSNPRYVNVEDVLARCTHTFTNADIYAEAEGLAQFGQEFRRVNKVQLNDKEIISFIRGHVGGLNENDYVFHPAIMDAVFQSNLGWSLLYDRVDVGGKANKLFFLPHTLKRAFRNSASPDPLVLPPEFCCYSVLVKWSVDFWVANSYVLGQRGEVLFTFEELELRSVPQNPQWPKDRYVTHWQPISLPASKLSGTLCHPTQSRDLVSQLQMLDQLSLRFIQQTNKLLHPTTNMPQGRQRYIQWLLSKSDHALSQSAANQPNQTNEEDLGLSSLVEMTQRVGNAHFDIVANPIRAVELLFQDDLMDQVYHQPPFIGPIFDEFTKHILSLVMHAKHSGKRVIRILEVGAGTGRLTGLLGKTLLQASLEQIYVDYYCSDVSIALAQGAMEKSSWPLISPLALDLDMPLKGQASDLASFDIIVGFDVLHATMDIQRTLASLHDLLVPGGHIGVIELDGESFAKEASGSLWMNFVFGSFQQWFGVLNDDALRSHCTLTLDEWRTALLRTNFDDLRLEFSEDNRDAVSHISFFAQRPPLAFPTPSSSESSPTPSTPESLQPLSPLALDANSTAPHIWSPERDFEPSTHIVSDLHKASSPSPSPIDIPRQRKMTPSPLETTIYRAYTAGDEISLVHYLRSLDASQPYKLWLYTSTDPPNMTLCGLVRTIRHEFPAWRIQLALFHPSWSTSMQGLFMQAFDSSPMNSEIEIKIDEEGSVYSPRVVAAPDPPTTELRATNSIEFNDQAVWRSFPSSLAAGDVEVTVSYINLASTLPGTEFSGVITAIGPSVSDKVTGTRVAGIARCRPGSTIVTAFSDIALLPDEITLHTGAAVIGRLTFMDALKDLIPSTCPKALIHIGQQFALANLLICALRRHGSDIMITYSGAPPPHLSALRNVYTSHDVELWTRKSQLWSKGGVPCIVNFDPRLAKESTRILSYRGRYIQIGGLLPSALPGGRRFTCLDLSEVVEHISSFLPDISYASISNSGIDFDDRLEVYPFSRRNLAYSRIGDHRTFAVLLDLNTVEPDLPVLKGGIIQGTHVFDPRRAYLVVGGIGSLGVKIAENMVRHGARYVVLTSRSGDKPFREGKLIREKKIVNYLRSLPGITLRLEAVDCNDISGMHTLLASFVRQLAGVFFLPAVLNDRPFIQLDREEYWTSGQANYSAAQTYMEALGSQIQNAVSIAIPPIIDGGMFVRSLPQGSKHSALDKYKSIGVVSREVAEYCIDAIRYLKTEDKISTYIPSSNWKKNIELAVNYHRPLMNHLLSREGSEAEIAPTECSIIMECATILSLNAKDISETVPLSSYGLDSLTSIRLSAILASKFGIHVTQLQLLGTHMTVERLNTLHDEKQRAMTNSPFPDDSTKDDTQVVDRLENAEDTLVRLNTVQEGIPLFILHGAGGGVRVLLKLASAMHCPAYGIQDTPDAPINGSLTNLCQFYLLHIRRIQPKGPYRIGGFSFGTCLAIEVATILRNEGEVVDTLVMLDGAPAIFQQSVRTQLAESSLQEDILDVVHDMANCGVLDDAEEVTQQFEQHFNAIANGSTGPSWVGRFCTAYSSHLLLGIRASEEMAHREAVGLLGDEWPSKRTVLIKGSRGVGSKPPATGLSATFDLERYAPSVEVFEVPGSHFGMLNPQSGIAHILNRLFGK
ncbi:hypothetical protein ONZ45_g14697 [Pleurotus djamor]|nr:hypothetical protein ONZ45_g14697 [Pleurotus djamor]